MPGLASASQWDRRRVGPATLKSSTAISVGARTKGEWLAVASITVFDGTATIGGNKIYLEERGDGLFLDFGINFAKHGMYFQEFLSERDARGIHDLVQLGMIPKLAIYRDDLITSDLDTSGFRKISPRAVLLSHAHLDHCGNIDLLDMRIPVVASATTAAILKALCDLKQSSVAYTSPRAASKRFGRLVLPSDKSAPYMGRGFYCAGDHRGIIELMGTRPSSEKARKTFAPGPVRRVGDARIGWEVEPHPVDHSIYGAMAYIVRRDTAIAYTGDLRLSGRNRRQTEEFIKVAKGAPVLICEGTRVGRESDLNVTEDDVFRNCYAAAEESKRLTIADFSARNFERLEMFHEIARRLGKRLVITAKDAYLLDAIGCADGKDRLKSGDILIYRELIATDRQWEVMKEDAWSEKYVDHVSISKDPGGYILCFSFFDMKHLLDIKPSGGTYIYSSSEAFSEEQEIDFRRLNAWLDHFGMDVRGFRMVGSDPKAAKPEFESGFHASGHLSAEELEKMILDIDPDLLIPVHTEDPRWFEKLGRKVLIPEEGKEYAL